MEMCEFVNLTLRKLTSTNFFFFFQEKQGGKTLAMNKLRSRGTGKGSHLK